MHSRCENPNASGYSDYGGRGISVCARWAKFENFLTDMGPRPEGKSIDRIDVNGDYTPKNCRWASSAEQARNRRDNLVLTLNGRSLVLSDWAREIGVKVATLSHRIKVGVPLAKALTTPTLPRNYDTPLRYPSRSEIRRARAK